ncbi:hypothetical protein JCM12681A_47390 [Streptomyces mexicanus]
MIKPEEIPQFTGDLELLEQDYAALKADAGHVRDTGRDVHNRFQGLSAYYTAPEAEQLFATTKPVKDRADSFADGLETVSGALAGYATEIRPLVKKLEDLKREATTFVASVKDDDDWEYDGDKVAHHNRIRDEVTRTVAAFWAAERTCHNKITALWHGTQMVAGDGSDKKNQYGFNAEDLKNAKLPWGDPVEEKHHWYEVGHWVKSFVWDGLIVDGVWGTIKGLGTLVGFGGWEAMGQAWKGLAQLATGLAISSIPGVGAMFWALPDDKLPSWIRDSRTAMKETGKALVAWDEWGKNPARAAGAVTFNVLTTVFTGGAGGAASGAGKAGAVAKVLSAAGKAGKVIDPMTYVAKGAGAGLSKIGDIAKGLKGIGKIDVPTLPDGSVHLPDGHMLQPNGNLLDHNGLPATTPIPQETVPGLPSYGTNPASHSLPHGVAQAMTNDGHVYGLPKAVDGGVPQVAGSGAHGAFAHTTGGVYSGTSSVPAGVGHSAGSGVGVHGGIPHGAGDGIPAGGHAGTTPTASSYDTPTSPAHDVPHTTPQHTPTATTPHTGGHETPYTGGHDTPYTVAHDTSYTGGHTDHGTGHGGHDTTAHGSHDTAAAHGAGHVGDHAGAGAGFGHDAVGGVGHDGGHAAAPGHSGTDVPGHGGAGESFAYTPHMSRADFDNLATDAEKHAVAAAELERGTNPWPSSSNEAAKEYGEAYWGDHVDNLDPQARGTLERYSSFYFQYINGDLREFAKTGTPIKPQESLWIQDIDRVIGTRPVPEDIMVLRETAIDHLELASPKDMTGQVFTEPGFTSVSLGETSVRYNDVTFHLRVPKGTHALYIDRISLNPGERELIIDRGAQYKVTRVFMDEKGKWHAYGEILPKSKP